MLQKTKGVETASISTEGQSIEELLTREWLLTNKRGGYASSTIVGCNTRRYHGLLIGSLNPPANRIMALANCLEMVIFNREESSCAKLPNRNSRKVFNLSTFEFGNKFAPASFSHIKSFRQDIGVHFDYRLAEFKLTKSLYLLHNTDTIALVYDFTSIREPAEFVLRPFIALRDFHSLQKSYAPLCSKWLGHGLLVRHDVPGSCELYLSCPGMDFEKDKQWWFNFIYRKDKERRQDFTEDLWTPGFFKAHIDSPTKIVLWANLSNQYKPEKLSNTDIETVCEDLYRHQSTLISAAKNRDKKSVQLCLSADQFIVTRDPGNEGRALEPRTTILSGFPWFADWGRDAFISLPGLLLSTKRFGEAKSVLTTFARAADDGMIPNRFDDNSDTAYFNSIDASLWFINAAFQYLEARGDFETFTQELLPAIRWIIESYYNGTRFGIHADTDGLITAGNEHTQLTWMDAKYDGVAITARYGKAVEINALWYNSLMLIAQFYAGQIHILPGGTGREHRNTNDARHYKSLADTVKDSFFRLFWNETTGYLNDCIGPDGLADTSLRPNQIFAVSLTFSPLSAQQQKSVVDVIEQNLLTPYGLRTLNSEDSRYKRQYKGTQQQRDEAYHQGTVWPYLMGAFVESWLKVHGSSRKNKKKAAEFIQPLLHHLTNDSCLGQISEIFDGDAPHMARGCIAQAWSVGELLRAYQLINS
ncbi:MAG: glycogen debranching enzyme family protein [Planctomycetota bacterium]|nr:MAG: glycogen debranching enzyme family protein [Planctomycetota bacterium]